MLAALPGRAWSEGLALLPAFAMSEPEKTFARELLRRKRNLWLYRCNQKNFCGDFIIVDMSSPRPEHRPALCLELKEGRGAEPLESPGLQLRRANEALAELERQTIITGESFRVFFTGGRRGMLKLLLAGSFRRTTRS